MVKPFKPLLASKADLEKLRFPVIASPKFDGIRCIITEDGPRTRSLKEIPNRWIRTKIELGLPKLLDGEIMTYDKEGNPDDFNTIQSKVMSSDGEPRFQFIAFDDLTYEDDPYLSRLQRLGLAAVAAEDKSILSLAAWDTIETLEDLMRYEERVVGEGFEGIMVRDPQGRYKRGRSTVKEQILLKVKRFHDAEAVVVGFNERMHNANEAKTNATGHTERSSHKSGLVPTGTLGSFRCVWASETADSWDESDIFEVGTGFDQEQRISYWRFPPKPGSIITVTYQELTKEGKPRFPVFKGFRSEEDIS